MIIEAPRFQGIAPTAGAPAGIMLLESNPAAANGASPSYSTGLITSAAGPPTGGTAIFPPLYIDNTTGVLHWYDGASWIAAQFGIGYVDTVADLSTIGSIVDGSFWQTSGYHTNNDQGGDIYRYDALSVAVCDGGSVLDGIGGENILAGAAATTYPGTGVGRFFVLTTTIANIRKYGAIGDGIADATFRIQAAINKQRSIVMVPDGRYLITQTLTLPIAAQTFTSFSAIASDTPNNGGRLLWGGAAGGVMMLVTAHAVRISGIRFDAMTLANTCISFTAGRSQGVEFCAFDNFVGNCLLLGDPTPNYNGFYGNDLLFLFAQGGTAININSIGTENISFRNLTITRTGTGITPGVNGLIKVDGSCHVCFYNMVLVDFGSTVYAMQFVGGATFGIYDLTAECGMTLSRSTSAMGRPCVLTRVELRSCNPQAGLFAMDLSASPSSPAEESSGFVVDGLRVRNITGATVIPQVRVQGATCAAAGVYFEESGVSPGKGSFVTTATGHIANMSYGGLNPNFQRFPLTCDTNSPVQGAPSGVAARMLGWDTTVLRVGAQTGWTNATYDTLSGKHSFRVAANVLGDLDSTIADGETALLVRRNVGGVFTLQRVLMGAPDSGSVLGRRALEVVN